MGDCGAVWSSAMGGGLGSRGDPEGERGAMVLVAMVTVRDRCRLV